MTIDEINDSTIYTKEHIMYAIFSVSARDDSLFADKKKAKIFDDLTVALQQEREPWQLLSIPKVIDIYEMLRHLLTLKKQTHHHNRLKLIDGEIDEVYRMADEGVREPSIYLKIWANEKEKKSEKRFEERIKELCNRLKSLDGMKIERLNNASLSFFCKQFAQLGSLQSEEDSLYESPSIGESSDHSRKIDFINEVTPVGGIGVNRNHLLLGDTKARIYGVSSYPRKLALSWAKEIMNNTNAVTSMLFMPGNTHELANALSKSAKQSNLEANTAKNLRDFKAREREVQTADRLIDRIDRNQEIIGRAVILTMPFSNDDEKFEEICENTISFFRKKRMNVKVAGQMQLEGFMSLLPYKTTAPLIEQAYSRLMPLKTLAGSANMCIDSIRDPMGIYFATTTTKGIISLNMSIRSGDRTNSNFVAFGFPGSGKSTLIKHILQTEIMQGTKIIIIDPQSEYHDLTRYLGGIIINLAGGNSRINIFEVKPPIPNDDEQGKKSDEEYFSDLKRNELAFHIQEVITIFQNYFLDADNVTMSMLENTIVELYKKFGITWDTDFLNMSPNEFPIMEDLYRLIQAKSEKDSRYEDLLARVETMAIGSAKFMFNGHTNVNTDSSVICFDIMDLQSMKDNVQAAQYKNILKYCWKKMSANRNEKVLLLIDEGYLVLSDTFPDVAKDLRDISKQGRKFNASLGFVAHEVIDVLHEGIRKYSQAIIGNATYKFFMKADGKNLLEIKEMFDLSDEQVDVMRTAIRGEMLAFIGGSIRKLIAEIPQYKLDNMGTAGGD